MKKLLLAFAFVAGLSGMASAQTATAVRPASKTVKPATTTAPAAQPQIMNAQGKKTPTVAAKPAAAVKKDGTPDMRYKANQQNAKPATTPVKKDGTPDKRFSANKSKKG